MVPLALMHLKGLPILWCKRTKLKHICFLWELAISFSIILSLAWNKHQVHNTNPLPQPEPWNTVIIIVTHMRVTIISTLITVTIRPPILKKFLLAFATTVIVLNSSSMLQICKDLPQLASGTYFNFLTSQQMKKPHNFFPWDGKGKLSLWNDLLLQILAS